MSKHFVRSIKNLTSGYSSVEIQVRNATSNDSWGPSSRELHEIALLTYHEKYIHEILNIIEKRLTDKSKNWRHVMKALTLLLYCVYEGSEDVILWLRRHMFLIKTLREFRYADSKNIDQGGPIRSKARVLTELIENEDKLEEERENYKRIREGMGKPGILDLSSSRKTLDLPPTPTQGSIPGSRMSSSVERLAAANKQRRSLEFPAGRYSLSLQTPPLHCIEEEYELAQIASRQ
ncbi:hypothetical protein TRVA0_038S00760 [Trichomonascus vanleenenianus]|uniref:uncharacterized protein n=1 Tax=Trichomonascus vanleenenianus TaxID=2268995 RepID=UPI003ECA1118